MKLGALPCFITPPQGFLTEESGVQTAALREQTDDAAHMEAPTPPKP